MTGPGYDRQAFCSRCGRPARVESASLDPRYPLVRCSRTDDEGKETGCGTRPGTYDALRAERLVTERRRDRATARHDEHIRAGKRSALCRTCETDPPPDRTTIHRFAEINDRIKLAAHLEFSHADRRMRVNLLRRDVAADMAAHRELHDAALSRPAVEIGAVVVLDGVKYRIRAITTDGLELAEAGPGWHRTPIIRALSSRTRLELDHAAGVWRVGPLARP